MFDHSELKRLALAAENDVNGHNGKFGAVIYWHKHQFSEAATPAAVLALITEVETLTATGKILGKGVDALGPRCDQLTAEVETLRKDSDRLQYLIRTSAIVCESDNCEWYWLQYSDGFSQ